MRRILVIGAGKSSNILLKYLLENAPIEKWQVWVGDRDLSLIEPKVSGSEFARAFYFDVTDEHQSMATIAEVDLVISMLPAHMHEIVASACVKLEKHLITPSYISPQIRALDEEAKNAGVLILNELGVDPGIDHMSAMAIMQRLKAKGAMITRFETFTGGLIAPLSDDNPWHYKFTWNPRNVVLAGQGGTARFRQNGWFKYIPTHKIFSRLRPISIDGYGDFEGYANRDSLQYMELYGIDDVATIFRGTLRRPGFCEAWQVLVQLGLTDDSFKLANSEVLSPRDFVNTFLTYDRVKLVEQKLREYIPMSDEVFEKLKWLGLFERNVLGLKDVSPAQMLQYILEKKWGLSASDQDMIVMWHRFDYVLEGHQIELESWMVSIGEDSMNTAMAKTVGLPLGVAAKLILQGKISQRGVHLPIHPEIYEPILAELRTFGIAFNEKENLVT